MVGPSVLWFRHGLRLHDNPALLEATKNPAVPFIPIFIFDGESAGTQLVGYNRMQFLLESLQDLDEQFRKLGGKLYVLKGRPVDIFRELWIHLKISAICCEQDCEPIWRERDESVERICRELGIVWSEMVSHTLWNPFEIIAANGCIPPTTYDMFLHTVETLGTPPRPVACANWSKITFACVPEVLADGVHVFDKTPTNPEDFQVHRDKRSTPPHDMWKGGETQALRLLDTRLTVEESAFRDGRYLPNQSNPQLCGPHTSLSAHLRFGCISVRLFYWRVHDLYECVQVELKRENFSVFGAHITSQLIWREYFYTMSVNNIYYAQMTDNPICLTIPWASQDNEILDCWRNGRTGFPLVDAAMRQLLAEGWLHHTLRNVVATFLTRGALWQNWEHGVQHFLKYLLDADWSVCAGNWMWVSSSAFEKLLDSSECTSPILLARRLDPLGHYIQKYVPELRNMPRPYIHEPWKAPISIQESIGCIVGTQYPARIIDLQLASSRNCEIMQKLRDSLITDGAPIDGPQHCRPSNDDEIRQFFWLHTAEPSLPQLR